MNKRNHHRISWKLLKNFFRVKLHSLILVSLTAILIIIYLYFNSLPDLHVFPGQKDYSFEFYTDSANGGNSKITNHIVSDTTIDIEFDLKEGFSSPYIGLCIRPPQNQVIKSSCYNLAQLDIEGHNIKSIGFSIFNLNPYATSIKNSNELGFYASFEILPERKSYLLYFNQLRVPDWWYETNNVSPNTRLRPDMSRILHINIGTAYPPLLGTKRSLRIYSITFRRDNNALILFLITTGLITFLLLWITYLVRVQYKKKASSITVLYKPMDIENKSQQLDGFVDYINRNYQENDLSLEQVSSQTGINQRRIANSLQQMYGCNFKSYVNQIRINESKRLLRESGLNIGEIAFKVGFNNQSHFNRVFKSMEGFSPTEFRESKK